MKTYFAYRIAALFVLCAVWYGLLALGVPLPWPFLVLFGSTAMLACISALTFASLLGSLFAWAPLDSLAFSALLALVVLVLSMRGRLLLLERDDLVWPDAYTEAARWCGKLLALIAVGYALAAMLESFDLRQVLLHALVAFLLGSALSRVPGKAHTVDRAALALTAVVTLFCFVLLELASRMLVPKPQVPLELFQHHPLTDFAHTPSLQMNMGFGTTDIADAPDIPIRINALGLRGEEIPTPKPAGELRVVCLGDSYTFGWGALEENTYPAQLAALLRQAHPGKSIRVINAGVGSYAPWQERILLREKFQQLAPDILVLQTFVTNDIPETLVRQGKVLETYSPEWLEFLTTYRFSGTSVFRFNRWLRRTCNLYFVFEHELMGDWALVRAYKRFRWRPSHGLPRPVNIADRLWIAEPDLKDWYPVLQEGFDAVCDDVDDIIDDCRRANVPVVAFNIPWFVGMMHRLPPIMERNEGMYEQGRAGKLMESHLASAADVAVPLIEEFLADPNPSRFTYNRDGHFVRETNALLAARLADALAPLLERAPVAP